MNKDIKFKVIKNPLFVTIFAKKNDEMRSLTLNLVDNKSNTYSAVINVSNDQQFGTRDGKILFEHPDADDKLKNWCKTNKILSFNTYNDPHTVLCNDSELTKLIAERLFEIIVYIEEF